MAFKAVEDVSVALPTSADELFAIHFGPGVTLGDGGFADMSGAAVQPTKTENNTYYFKEGLNVHWINVKTADTNNAILVDDADTKVVKTDGKSGTKGGAAFELAGTLDSDLWVYQAAKYEVQATLNNAKVGGVSVATNDKVFVKYDATVEITELPSSETSVIAVGGDKLYDTTNVKSLTAGTTDAKLHGAFKLSVKNVDVKVYKDTTNVQAILNVNTDYYIAQGTESSPAPVFPPSSQALPLLRRRLRWPV